MPKSYYAHELPSKSIEAIRNSKTSKEAEELNKLLNAAARSRPNG